MIVKISKIRLDRLEQIQNEKDFKTMKEESVKDFYSDYNRLDNNDGSPISSVISNEVLK